MAQTSWSHPTMRSKCGSQQLDAALVLLGDRDDAVPVVGGRAVVLGDEDREEILHAVFGRDAVEQVEALVQFAGRNIEGRFIGRDVLVAQLRDIRRRAATFADFAAASIRTVARAPRGDPGTSAGPGGRPGRRLVEQDRRLGAAWSSLSNREPG